MKWITNAIRKEMLQEKRKKMILRIETQNNII